MDNALGILVALTAINVAFGAYQLIVIRKFERMLAAASAGAADHFEKLRKVRQVGV